MNYSSSLLCLAWYALSGAVFFINLTLNTKTRNWYIIDKATHTHSRKHSLTTSTVLNKSDYLSGKKYSTCRDRVRIRVWVEGQASFQIAMLLMTHASPHRYILIHVMYVLWSYYPRDECVYVLQLYCPGMNAYQGYNNSFADVESTWSCILSYCSNEDNAILCSWSVYPSALKCLASVKKLIESSCAPACPGKLQH